MASAAPSALIDIDFLCPHLEFDDFDCGDETWNNYVQDSRKFDSDPASFTYLVAHEGPRVLGFVALTVADYESGEEKRPAFMVPAIAVDVSVAGGNVGIRLLEEAAKLIVARQELCAFSSVMVFSGFEGEYGAMLKRMGLTEFGGFGLWQLPL